jgi:hypothetical protein
MRSARPHESGACMPWRTIRSKLSGQGAFDAPMDGRQRRFLGFLTLMALGCLVLQAWTGETQLALHLTPLFLLVSLLLSGHYVAEDRIVEVILARRILRTRVRRARWAQLHETVVVSLLDRSPLCRRGPPARLALVA